MLVKPKISNYGKLGTFKQGLYITENVNINHSFTQNYKRFDFIENKDSLWSDFDSYGVCDSPQQFYTMFGKELEDKKEKIAIFFSPFEKKTQPSDGGWRWHKWGKYIGTENPTCEYIYDEPKIEKVYVFQIFSFS